jgi:hypothetical protein
MVSELAPIIGSLAQYDSKILIESGVLEPLFECLNNDDVKVVESCARAIRALVHKSEIMEHYNIQEKHINVLLNLSCVPGKVNIHYSIQISEICIMILCKLAHNRSVRQILSDIDGVSILVEWLNEKWNIYPNVQGASIDALSSLCKQNRTLAAEVGHCRLQSGKSVFVLLFKLLGDKRNYSRLCAANCLAELYITDVIPSEFESQIFRQLLPSIIRLFDDDHIDVPGVPLCTIQQKALELFAILVENHPKLQIKALVLDY